MPKHNSQRFATVYRRSHTRTLDMSHIPITFLFLFSLSLSLSLPLSLVEDVKKKRRKEKKILETTDAIVIGARGAEYSTTKEIKGTRVLSMSPHKNGATLITPVDHIDNDSHYM